VLTIQDKNKYNTPKYRFVVRFTSSQVIVQVVRATVQGDQIIAYAFSKELKNYGISFGLKNYAAAYATGLLCARRLLTSFKLDKLYKGQEKPDGSFYQVEAAHEGPRPFRALLDVGLVRTTTGHRVFGAMKGAVDGGLDIPHNEKRLPGYDKETKKFDPALLKKMIFGGHVADYMEHLKGEDAERYQSHFSVLNGLGKSGKDLAGLYAAAHAAIRKDPKPKITTKKPKDVKFAKKKALSYQQRKARVQQKLAARAKAAADE
jgi:large subunit ribosomal protein L5e